MPGGHLQFRCNAGDLRLASSGFDWLVVTNSKRAKFQGFAEIDGLEGLFPFRVDARDGGNNQEDRFVIKIWAPDADPDVDDPISKASGDVGGGNIKIHN